MRFMARDPFNGVVVAEADSLASLQQMLRREGWMPQVLCTEKGPAPRTTVLVRDETGMKWEREGRPRRAGSLGVSVTEYAYIEEVA